MKSPIVLGLTGSIGTGKSTVARMLRHLKIPVIDADQIVHTLYETSLPLLKKLASYKASLVKEGKVDRQALADYLLCEPSFLSILEKSVHPLVKEALIQAVEEAKKQGERIIVLEVPLLFEVGFDTFCDFTLVVYAPEVLQKERVLKRSQMTEERFQALLRRQLPQAEKRRRADFLLDTSDTRVHTFKELLNHLERICRHHA